MENKAKEQTLRHHAMEAMEKEQEFCLKAMQTAQYDSLSDDEWVELCERVAKRHLRKFRQASA